MYKYYISKYQYLTLIMINITGYAKDVQSCTSMWYHPSDIKRCFTLDANFEVFLTLFLDIKMILNWHTCAHWVRNRSLGMSWGGLVVFRITAKNLHQVWIFTYTKYIGEDSRLVKIHACLSNSKSEPRNRSRQRIIPQQDHISDTDCRMGAVKGRGYTHPS